MRAHLLDYARCAQCRRTTPREDRDGWIELTVHESFFGLFDLPPRKMNVCSDRAPNLYWPHRLGRTK